MCCNYWRIKTKRKEELFGNEKEQFSISEDRLDDFKKFKDFCLKSATLIKKGKPELIMILVITQNHVVSTIISKTKFSL